MHQDDMSVHQLSIGSILDINPPQAYPGYFCRLPAGVRLETLMDVKPALRMTRAAPNKIVTNKQGAIYESAISLGCPITLLSTTRDW
jgi:hypothetical protein